MITLLKTRILFLVLILLCLSLWGNSQVVTGHYGPGLFGLRSAHGYPMGWSYVNVTHFYYAGEMKNNEGKISTLARPLHAIANINGVAFGKSLEDVGLNYNAVFVAPLTNLAPNPETLELDPNNIGLADIYLIPLMLSKNFSRLALNTRYGVWLPTGSYTAGNKSNKGKGFWSHNFGLGLTAYLSKDKSWHASLMNSFEVNSKQEGTNITAPPSYVGEWGIGKTFNSVFNMGIIGYTNRQIGKQKGGELPANLKYYRVNAVGMEFNYRTENKWVFMTRWYLEYLAKNRPEGTAIRFIVLKNF